jgi:hypothetical protein
VEGGDDSKLDFWGFAARSLLVTFILCICIVRR